MTKNELKKQILNKINKASQVYVYNGFSEFYFKTRKSDLLYHFHRWYKRSNYKGNENCLLEWLNDYNDRVTIDDDNNLMFD